MIKMTPFLQTLAFKFIVQYSYISNQEQEPIKALKLNINVHEPVHTSMKWWPTLNSPWTRLQWNLKAVKQF